MGWNMWLLMDQELKPKRRRNTLFNIIFLHIMSLISEDEDGPNNVGNQTNCYWTIFNLALFQVGLLPNKQIGLNG